MKFSLPLSVVLPRKTKADKKLILNLNVYRTTHYQILNNAKVLYVELVKKSIERAGLSLGTTFPGLVELRYTLYPKTRRITDVANPCSIIDKFACDSLVHLGIIEADDYTKVHRTVYQFGGVDKHNPRCDLEIVPL